MLQILIGYLAMVNVVAFVTYGIDKLKARRNQWRIPESTLLLLAMIGGSIGAWIGLKVWRPRPCTRSSSTEYP